MYICNCNGLSESAIRQAIRNGAKEWHDVHAYYKCEPCCGKCECDIRNALAEAETTEAGHSQSNANAGRICSLPQLAVRAG